MTQLTLVSSPEPEEPSGSPFDGLKRHTATGGEYWSARELMPLLGYDKWERFEDVIERAMAAARNAGYDVNLAFSRRRENGTKWTPGAVVINDVWFSRFGAYLVAMNGDPRKTEIAGAQSYFAIKTREAETIAPALPRSYAEALRELATTVERAEAEALRASQAERSLAVADKIIETTAEDVEFSQDYLRRGGCKTLADFGRATTVGPIAIIDVLREIGLLQQERPIPYMRYVKDGRFLHDPVTGDVKITPKGEKWVRGQSAFRQRLRGRPEIEGQARS